MEKCIVFTGGGSAGHVTPNIAIINQLDHSICNIQYIGSKTGIEKDLITKMNIPYFGISSGKLRRYLTFKNVTDIARVLKGCIESRRILKKLKPVLLFSKGGFVSVPVIIAASSLGIPIYIHESDITPGLANMISKRFATKVFTSFQEAKKYFPKEKTTVIGSPIRKELLNGSRQKGLEFLNYSNKLPTLTIMGGSLGAKKINELIRSCLDELTEKFQIVHLCGKGNVDDTLLHHPNYRQFEYLHEELAHVLNATDVVITRGGSNAIFEFLALQIPMIIVPLSKKQSRGDQILNGEAFVSEGFAKMIEEENLNKKILLQYLDQVQNESAIIKSHMKASNKGNGLDVLVDEINHVLANY